MHRDNDIGGRSKLPGVSEPERDRVGRVYRRHAKSPGKQRAWSATNPGNAAIRAELVGAAFALADPELRGARDVLDVGCGSGWWLEQLAGDDRVTASLHGVELLSERGASARARVPGAAVRLGDARALAFPDRSFDAVTLFTVLSSLPNLDAVVEAVREARRVLRPPGALLIWEPRVPNPLNRDTLLIGRGVLERALAGDRVEIRTLTVLPGLARRLGAHTDRFYPALARVPALRSHRLVCARPI